MKLAAIGKAAFLGLALATGIATGCSSKQTGSPSASGSGDPTGSVVQELRLGRSTHINKANYTLTGPNSFSQSGVLDVSKLRELEGTISGVPTGSPYTLTVTANSTNGNVSCSGSKSGLVVTCPGNRPQDEDHFKITCTRNHVGREWGDDDWKENVRTFSLGVEVNLACAQQDAGSDATVDSGSDASEAGPDVGPDVCSPKACPAGDDCGTLSDGCGGTATCGTMNGGCPSMTTCGGGGVANHCGCTPSTAACGNKICGTAPDGCGGTANCGPLAGACPTGQTCDSTGACLSCPASCPAGDNCGTVSNPPTCPNPTLTCAPNNCAATGTNQTCGGGGVANHCGCTPSTAACGTKTCGTAPDGCGGTANCGPNAGACPSGQTCDSSGTCLTCAATCPAGDNCGSVSNPAGCPVTTLNCGTCPTSPPNESCGGGTPGTANHCGCTPTAAATACGSNVCGTAPDGCGGTVNCGPLAGACPGTQTCNSSGQCVACATTCPTGDNCGSVSNPAGCSQSTVACGTCSTAPPNQNTTCGGGPNPVANHCGCTPTAAATACGTKVCGTAPDGCGGTVNCGPNAGLCPNGGTCTASGTCITCLTTCPTGDNCGTISNPAGCAQSSISCGTCPTTNPNEVCGGGPNPVPNVCGCTPTATATVCGSNKCGTAADGCGGTPSCGTCAAGSTCSIPAGATAGTCKVSNTNLCDPTNPAATTLGCLQQQDKPATIGSATQCSTCAANNSCLDPASQGGTCETTTGNANMFPGTLPDGKTCSQVFAPFSAPVSETNVCLDVLNTVFTSKCAASLQETPCVCGTVDVGSCTSGTIQANGPGFDEFACDFNSTNVGTINAVETNFTVQTFGAGQANALIQCAAINGCDCF